MIFTQKQKTLSVFLTSFLALFLGLDFLVPHAFADPLIDGNNYVQQIAEKLTIFHQFFSPLINFFSTHIGNFLGNDYIFAGNMGEMLKSLWVISRNIVNIFFVGALLWVAIKAVAGDFFGEETDLKKEILKIAVFLVVVNFSWLGTKVVLDASNVATNVAFSLPTGVSNVGNIDLKECTINPETGRPQGSCKVTGNYFVASASSPDEMQHLSQEECKQQKIDEAYKDVFLNNIGGEINPSADPENVEKYAKKTTFCWGNLDLFDYNQNTAVIYLTYGMAKIQDLGASHADTNNFSKMAVASIFSLLIQITYTVAILALFILMIVRMAMLWLFVGFSPALVVILYLGGGEGPVSNFGPSDFIKWCFVPAQVGLILSAGFIMIAAGQANSELLSNLNQNVNLEGGFYNSISVFSGMDNVFNLIWLIIVELVFAIAVYAPMKEMPFAGTVIGPIAEFAKSTLTSLAKTPLIAPIIPITNTDGSTSKVSFRDLGQSFKSKIEWRQGASSDPRIINRLEDDARDLRDAMKRDNTIEREILNELKNDDLKTLSTKFNMTDLRSVDDDIKQSTLEEAFEGTNIKKNEIDKIIKLINRGVSSAPAPSSSTPSSSTPSSSTPSSSTPSSSTSSSEVPTGGADTSEAANKLSLAAQKLKNDPDSINTRNTILTGIKTGDFSEMNKYLDLTQLKLLSAVDQNKVLIEAGFDNTQANEIVAALAKK